MFIYCIKDEVFVQWEFGENFIEPSFQKPTEKSHFHIKLAANSTQRLKIKKKMKRGSLTF